MDRIALSRYRLTRRRSIQAGRDGDAAADHVPSEPQEADTTAARSRGAGLVLIADDTFDTRELYDMYLTQCGFAVLTVTDGEAAVQTALESRPDVIVLASATTNRPSRGLRSREAEGGHGICRWAGDSDATVEVGGWTPDAGMARSPSGTHDDPRLSRGGIVMGASGAVSVHPSTLTPMASPAPPAALPPRAPDPAPCPRPRAGDRHMSKMFCSPIELDTDGAILLQAGAAGLQCFFRSELLRVLRRRLAPDLGDLAVAVAHQPLHIAPQILVQQLDLLTGRGLAERGLVENLPLGALRPVDLAGLGDGALLGVGERAITDVGLLVLLLKALHCQLERALGGVVGHRPQCNRVSRVLARA